MRIALCYMSGNASFAGGVDQVVWSRAQMLVKEGHSVSVFCQSNEGMATPLTFEGVDIFPVRCPNILTRRVGVLHPLLPRYMADAIALQNAIRPIDLIDLHDSPLARTVGPFAKKHAVPLAFTIHSATTQIPYQRTAPIRKYLLESEQAAIRFADLLLPVSAYVASAFEGVSRGKLIHVVHNAMSADAQKVGAKSAIRLDRPDALNLVFASRLNHVKGLDILLDALGLLRDSNLELHLDVYGKGREENGLKNLSSKLGLKGIVDFRGFESDRLKLLGAIASSDAFVAPTRYEALSISAIEALSCGVPTILSDIAPCLEVGGDAALYFPLDNAPELAALLRRLASNVELRHEFAAKAKARSTSFRSEVILPKLLTAYEEALYVARAKMIGIPRTSGLRISVLVPAFNVERYIGQAVFSAVNQSVRALEVIVGDDASTDNTNQIASALGARVVSGPKANGSVARNRAAAEASGDLLFFLDGDDWWHPAKIEAHLSEWERHPEAAFVYDPAFVVHQGAKASGIIGEYGTHDPDWRNFLHWRSWASGSCFSIRRENYERVEGFREDLVALQDVDFWVRAAHILGPARRLDRAFTYYRILPRSVSRSPKDVKGNLENALAGWSFLSESERREFSRQVLLTAARWCQLRESLSYVSQAGWPMTSAKTWKVLARASLASLRAMLSPADH
jgi:glycosyltransferase involved in cell wall biosynthesis